MSLPEPAWVKIKAEHDALDDGRGPWYPITDEAQVALVAQTWAEFVAWASLHLGQGYSLACSHGDILNEVTSWAFAAFAAGKGVNL